MPVVRENRALGRQAEYELRALLKPEPRIGYNEVIDAIETFTAVEIGKASRFTREALASGVSASALSKVWARSILDDLRSGETELAEGKIARASELGLNPSVIQNISAATKNAIAARVRKLLTASLVPHYNEFDDSIGISARVDIQRAMDVTRLAINMGVPKEVLSKVWSYSINKDLSSDNVGVAKAKIARASKLGLDLKLLSEAQSLLRE